MMTLGTPQGVPLQIIPIIPSEISLQFSSEILPGGSSDFVAAFPSRTL